MGDETHIKDYLVKELSGAGKPTNFDELLEILDFETGLSRVNLRSWKEQFGEDVDLLWKLMLRAQNNTPTTTELFITRWNQFTRWIEKKVIFYPSGAEELVSNWIKLVRQIATEVKNPIELPMVSHSPMYKMFYSPSYRIVNENDLFP